MPANNKNQSRTSCQKVAGMARSYGEGADVPAIRQTLCKRKNP